uniref:Golgi associated RAB2 interactor protein-like Rab2B-binding domain-containing protein n=1 Tax=Erpetoichthys calabaricus TaxID=27687 RepID=A0A8C4XAN1_ERPCA
MSRPCLQRVLISKVRGVLKMSKITALKLTTDEIGRLAVRCSEDDQKTLHAFCGNVILENNFVEVTRSGHFHSQAGLSVVTLLVASTNPFLRMPDKLLVGRPVPRVLGAKEDGHLHRGLRHLQSKYVKLTVHSEALRLLRLELRAGPVYYLRLLVAPGAAKDAFDLWVKLAVKLREMSPEEEKARPYEGCCVSCDEDDGEKEKSVKMSQLRGLTSDHRLGLHGLVYPHLGVVQSARWDIGMMKS